MGVWDTHTHWYGVSTVSDNADAISFVAAPALSPTSLILASVLSAASALSETALMWHQLCFRHSWCCTSGDSYTADSNSFLLYSQIWNRIGIKFSVFSRFIQGRFIKKQRQKIECYFSFKEQNLANSQVLRWFRFDFLENNFSLRYVYIFKISIR
jgi:hypothetical protein